MTTVEEIWKLVNACSGYAVSNYGKCKSLSRVLPNGTNLKGRILKPIEDRDGYLRYGLSRRPNGVLIKSAHRLVVEAFIGSIPDGLQVNHIDGNKKNNFIGNLEICTLEQNVQHAHRTGLISNYARGVRSASAKLTEADVLEIRERYDAGNERQQDIAEDYGIQRESVSKIGLRKRWKHI